MDRLGSKTPGHASLTGLTSEIVAAYVAHNSVPAGELPTVLASVHAALVGLDCPSEGADAEVVAAKPKPAVPVRKSITDDYLVSLEDGQRFKSLKRHLMTHYGLTPEQYREKWGLPKDYPMVAPAYAKSRSALAKSFGLGRKVARPGVAPASATVPKARRRRLKAAA